MLMCLKVANVGDLFK